MLPAGEWKRCDEEDARKGRQGWKRDVQLSMSLSCPTGFHKPESAMPLETFIVTVYCLVCEALNTVVPGGNPRKRGFPPKLSDAEALTMAFIGTVLGYRSDKAVWAYFRRHWAAWFPHLGDRSTLVRQWAQPRSRQSPSASALGQEAGGVRGESASRGWIPDTRVPSQAGGSLHPLSG